jgi:hypothetical protein
LSQRNRGGRGRSTPISRRRFLLGVVALVVLSGGLVGCTGTSPEPSLPSSQASSPSSSPPVESAAVPDVVGLSLTKAKSQAEQSGFQVTVEKKYSGKRAGTVLSVDPVAGTALPTGSTLSLTVAKPFPRVPNVVGMKVKAAKRTLEKKHFEVKIKKQTSSQPKETVLAQSPSAGTVSRLGRTVTLTIAVPPVSTGGGGSNCTPGYSPCLPLGPSDYDCYGGGGNGPAYTQPGVVYQVSGSDPYGLDSNHDGLACG